MKRWKVWALLTSLCLLMTGFARAEGRKDYYGMFEAAKSAGDEALMAEIRAEMPARLHWAKDEETGLYGYINYLGEWAIPPQYAYAGEFRGDYAAVSTGDPWDDTMGIIDRDGNWVVEPHYFFDEGYDGWTYGGLNTGMYLVWDHTDEDAEERYHGYFDVRSGYLSQRNTGDMTWWSDAELVPVDDYDEETDEEIAVYLRRSTGEEAIRLEGYSVDWLMHTSEFHNGFAMIYSDAEDRCHIINEQGEILDLPDCLVFYSSIDHIDEQRYAFGLLLCRDTETGLYGYWDLIAMDWRVPPQYVWADQFAVNGCACVQTSEGRFGHIDPQGRLLADGFSCAYDFKGDYAWVADEGLLINAAGETVLALTDGWRPQLHWDDELNDACDYYVSPGGVLVVIRDHPIYFGWRVSGLMTLVGDWLLDPEIYSWHYSEIGAEPHRFFSEGLQAVAKIVGVREWRTVHNVKTGDYEEPVYAYKIGYVDEQGNTVVDFLYDEGGAFLGGLAEVMRGDEVIYVNAFGHEVFSWHAAGR